MTRTLCAGPGFSAVLDDDLEEVRLDLPLTDCSVEAARDRLLVRLPPWLFRQIAIDGVRALVPALQPSPGRVPILAIQQCVARHFVVALADLQGVSRRKNLVLARHVAMFLARELTDMSFPELGEAFHRDHSTVHYGWRRVQGDVEGPDNDPVLAHQVNTIKAALLDMYRADVEAPVLEAVGS